ncbi:MAG: NYN domain-containing protein [Elusimicrobia bacterium]|nr:NYN domain-containing protein [Elusimicrobiota bacterium]
MLAEPAVKRVFAFIDGQNLFYAAKDAYGYNSPNYNPKALAEKICIDRGWTLVKTKFYTGVPDPADNKRLNEFWVAKLLKMSRQGVETYSRALKYRNKSVKLPDGKAYSFLSASEKGIDIRIALDVIRSAILKEYDVALIFSQDQDFTEVADEVRLIAVEQDRWIKVASAYPSSPTNRNTRGINKTEWIKIDRATYDACLDVP